MSEQQKQPEQKPNIAQAMQAALGEATREVLTEQQTEIIRRARAKLVAMGLSIEDAP